MNPPEENKAENHPSTNEIAEKSPIAPPTPEWQQLSKRRTKNYANGSRNSAATASSGATSTTKVSSVAAE
jgi:hypothetical protein